MKAVSLFGVFVLAKMVTLAGHSVPLSPWTPLAYFWQDTLAALVFAAAEVVVRRWRRTRWLSWALYGAAVCYAAVNVAVARVLSSQLTWPMMRAARGALADSIKHHATSGNVALMALIVCAGIVLPLVVRRVAPQLNAGRAARTAFVIASCALVLLGPLASARIETIGLHRNAVVALAATALPRIASEPAGDDWRASPFGDAPGEDLTHLRGAAAGRNVVLIVLESAGAEYLRPYGAPSDPTPNLTALARRAVLFEQAYAVYPESIKALFSVLCAQYPAMDTATEGYAQIAAPALAAALADSGYRTALFHSGRFMYLGMDSVVAGRGYQTLEDAGAISGAHESSFGVDEPSTVRRALAWVDSVPRGERFFLTYLPIAGHHPYDTPQAGPFAERSDFDRYLNALHYGDAALGELMRGLSERGLADDTLFVIFGDHGEAFGQHEGNYGHSLFLYEENVRVPYLLIAPGLFTEQVRVARPVSLVDTAPTILDLLGLPLSETSQGGSMLEGRNRLALFYADYSLSFLGLRDGCWKYVYELESGRSKLFDLCRDAGERDDVAAYHPERIAAYRAHVRRWGAAQKAAVTQAQVGKLAPP
jgi:lipoteichoic acid synthase